ncbi:MAG TPA: class I SAM-dependent methyltransferase [Solirubrobacteraceae bacterium]|nr:class I SAM-dependent methyltransferase [Solirubrobacteraceae bacterium]
MLSPRTSLTTRTSCRICGSPDLVPVLSLGDQYIAGAFAEPGGQQPVSRRVPLELVRCDTTRNEDGCGLVQLRHTVPGAILYRSYWYRSGVNETMTHNLHQIAEQAEEMVSLRPGDLVIDIGCNDGTLFDGYKASDLKYLGFDPSDVGRYAVEKGYEVVRDFYAHEHLRQRHVDRRARVITSIAMFYDLEYPCEFVQEVSQALADDGVWVIELHYLPAMLDMNQFDAIVHEHLEYYSLAVIERLLGDAGLGVVRAEVNAINGGSVRLFVRRASLFALEGEDAELLQQLRVREFEMALDAPQPYERFAAAAERVREDLAAMCHEIVEEGKTIHVYGASTKGNTILQYAGIDHTLVPYAADRNPDKHGSETIGTKIPIISEAQSRALRPDYYLALPWHFLDEFLDRETEFLDRGGQFIIPMPEVRLVSRMPDVRIERQTRGGERVSQLGA